VAAIDSVIRHCRYLQKLTIHQYSGPYRITQEQLEPYLRLKLGIIDGCSCHRIPAWEPQSADQSVLALPLQSSNQMQPPQSSGSVRLLPNFGVVLPLQSSGLAQPLQTLGLVQPLESVGMVQPSQSSGLVHPLQSLGLMQPLQTLGLVQSLQSFGLVQPVVDLTNSDSDGSAD
jgi:hypothetical protein